jgi:hypothetical protein
MVLANVIDVLKRAIIPTISKMTVIKVKKINYYHRLKIMKKYM